MTAVRPVLMGICAAFLFHRPTLRQNPASKTLDLGEVPPVASTRFDGLPMQGRRREIETLQRGMPSQPPLPIPLDARWWHTKLFNSGSAMAQIETQSARSKHFSAKKAVFLKFF
ncbi:hypothetical protein [Agrobacterium sp. V1]|uniref:hypothetical protein n=1 Tax=Agrobacterium sp. V1 TaxID=3061957 RepID=UPI002670F46B|nr:hypothetical protein [Agrobacterium sp. V1]MDO3442102.1 hypothetical protein [Agrobacterium sp. V1]